MAALRQLAISALSSVVLSIAACGPLDEREHTPSPNSIRIGVLSRNTPRFAAFAARLAAREINAGGGVLGRPIEIVAATDRQCDANHSPKVVRSLLDQGAIAIVVALCSGAVKSDLENVAAPTAADVALVSVSASSPALTGIPNFYRTMHSDVWQGRFLAEEVFKQGLPTVAIVHSDDVYGTTLTDAFVERYESRGGKILARVSTKADKVTGFRSELEALFAAGKPSAIVIVSLGITGAGLSRDIASFGDRGGVRFFGSEALFSDAFLRNADLSVAEGMEGLTPGADPDDPSHKAFVADYQAVLGEEIPAAEKPRLAGFYDSVFLLALAMERGQGTTTKIIRENIIAVSGTKDGLGVPIRPGEFGKAKALLSDGQPINYEGATGPIDFDENGDTSRGSYLRWRVSGGAYVTGERVSFP